jgi:ankyrin repeat protein
MRRLTVALMLLMTFALPTAADDWDDLRAAIYYQRDVEVVELLDSGVDVNMIGPDGWTPLMIAAEQDDVHAVKYLLDRGADPSIKNDYGRTAFDITTSSQVKRLVRVPVEDPFGRNRPLTQEDFPASQQGSATTEPWTTGLPPVNSGSGDQQLWNDARWNIEYNQMDELARVLDQEGLDINMRGPDGWTLLMTAAWKDKADFVEFLLSRGADPHLSNDKGETAADLSTSDGVLYALDEAGAAPTPSPEPVSDGVDLAYCKQLGGQAYLLCDSDDLTCRMSALNDQQQCEATGVWP